MIAELVLSSRAREGQEEPAHWNELKNVTLQAEMGNCFEASNLCRVQLQCSSVVEQTPRSKGWQSSLHISFPQIYKSPEIAFHI